MNIFPTIPVNGDNINSDIKYYDWDEATTVRAAATIAEGAVFPESTAKWKQYNLPIRKIGDTLPVSEEFFEDEAMFAAELQLFLMTNVDIVIDDQIINGDGTGTELTGLITSSPAFTAAASGISDASIYDLLVKVSEDITTNRGSKYIPNFALMNIADINKMKLKKDANDNYVMPPFVSRDGQDVSGMLIVEDNNVVANTMVVGDTRYGKLYQRAGLTVSRGEVDAQFVEDMMTLKVRKRLAFLVREVDKTGFRYIADIDADLVTLAT
jgi:HK97 family phage major capsid protein